MARLNRSASRLQGHEMVHVKMGAATCSFQVWYVDTLFSTSASTVYGLGSIHH
jgi:hypothetical protein